MMALKQPDYWQRAHLTSSSLGSLVFFTPLVTQHPSISAPRLFSSVNCPVSPPLDPLLPTTRQAGLGSLDDTTASTFHSTTTLIRYRQLEHSIDIALDSRHSQRPNNNTSSTMSIRSTLVALCVTLATAPAIVSAHMQMQYPPPFRSTFNPHVDEAHKEYSMTSPLDASGANFPCKGFHTDFTNDPNGLGASVADWAPGSSQTIKLAGTAYHGGGSCQVSFSYDAGNTFNVVRTYLGNCPTGENAVLDFTVPNDTPAGDAIFAWTWFNQLGNREMYMNCAHVKITGESHDVSKFASSRPEIFKANIGNGCRTVDSRDVAIPNPGNDVVSAGGQLVAPEGSCDAAVAPQPQPTPEAPAPPPSSASPEGPAASSAAPAPSDAASSAAPGPASSAAPSASASASSIDLGGGLIAQPSPSATTSTSSASAPSPTSTGKKQCVRRKKRGVHGKKARRHAAGPLRATF